jgi:hypothetical protein
MPILRDSRQKSKKLSLNSVRQLKHNFFETILLQVNRPKSLPLRLSL